MHKVKPWAKFRVHQRVLHVDFGPAVVAEIFHSQAVHSFTEGLGWTPVFYRIVPQFVPVFHQGDFRVAESTLTALED